MKKYYLLFGLMLLLISCKSPYSTIIKSHDCESLYYGKTTRWSNLHMRSYFDSLGNPQKRIHYSGDGIVITFHYDSNQVLTEEFRQLRGPNFGFRTLMKYDSIGRLIGYYRTYSHADEDINIDSISVEQLFFYDDQDRLIRKKTNHANGVLWKLIEYENDTIKRKTETLENDTISSRNYFYKTKN